MIQSQNKNLFVKMERSVGKSVGLFKKYLAEPQTVAAVIVAAGRGERMAGVDKQALEIEGTPVLIHCIQAFQDSPEIDQIVVVCREDMLATLLNLVEVYSLYKVSKLVTGGETRQQSVFKGIAELGEEVTYCAIHDGARPFVSAEVIARCIEAVKKHRAVTAAVPVKDTIKVADNEGFILSTPPRDSLYMNQTPQVFAMEIYQQAMAQALQTGQDFTDDCQLVENIGHKVFLCQGDYFNIKITTPEDAVFAYAIAQELEL